MSMESGTTPQRIKRLPDHLINQIAAGEVIERPAAAVKELVENSLDAGSRRIEVRLINGGLDEIQILDDGHGIAFDDLELALARHATSKLATFSDLDRIGTFGFRGEALSSIASVARVQIRSKTQYSDTAFTLVSEPGQTPVVEKSAGADGTLITVRELFFNVPARQKFLKSAATEFSHCQKVIRDLALGNPMVSFSLYHQGRASFSAPAADRLHRFTECLRPGWQPLHLQETQKDFAIEALLSPPDVVQDRGECLFFVNSRAVRSKTLAAAVRNVYLECLGNHHEPSGVVYVDIRKDWVDVNVHPQKLEVRILRQEGLYQWLVSQLRKRLGTPPPAPLKPQMVMDGPRFEIASGGLRILGQLASGLVAAEAEGDLLLIDPHRWHALSLLQQWQSPGPESEALAVPLVVALSSEQFAAWQSCHEEWERLGLSTRAFGQSDIVIHHRPRLLPTERLAAFCTQALHAAPNTVASLLACTIALKRTERLTDSRLQQLLPGFSPEWLKQPPSGGCQHGHNLYFRLPSASLRKHFDADLSLQSASQKGINLE